MNEQQPATAASVGPREELGALRRFAIKERGRLYFIDLDDIEAIEAHGNYLHLTTATGVHRLRHSLSAIERRLDVRFIRIHRSHIVRFDLVREVHFLEHGDCTLLLSNSRPFRVGRRYRVALRNIIRASGA